MSAACAKLREALLVCALDRPGFQHLTMTGDIGRTYLQVLNVNLVEQLQAGRGVVSGVSRAAVRFCRVSCDSTQTLQLKGR